jgi:hypothetical protein
MRQYEVVFLAFALEDPPKRLEDLPVVLTVVER